MPERPGRKAYPARNTFGQVFERLGLSGSLVDCTQEARVDGELLTEIVNVNRTPRPFEIRPEAKFSEAFAGAVAACWVGLRGVEISTILPNGAAREAPDLLLQAVNHQPVDVEIVRVDETAATRVRLFKIQERFGEMTADQPGLKTNDHIRFTVDFEKTKTLAADDFKILGDELLAFWRGKLWKMLPQGRHASVFSEGTVADRCGLIVEVNRSTYAALLTFAQADEMTPFEAILDAIAAKRQINYKHANALWLVVEVADPRFPFTKALKRIVSMPVELSPFSRVIIYDGHLCVVLGGSIL